MAAAIFATAITAAGAQTDQQRNAINHLVDATLVGDRCPRMSLNQTMAGMIAVTYGFSAEDLGPTGRYSETMLARVTENKPLVDGMDEDAVCVMGVVLFGPDGTNVPGLLTQN
tara:strand:- start:2584 stop:2922 length:339 start_codon:yes stop_codon:yes gene_type:complete